MTNRLLICLFLLVTLFSCQTDLDDIENENWQPTAAVPLVFSTLTVDDVLTELNHPEEVIILENGTVALNYTGELFSFQPENLLSIEPISFVENVSIGATEAAAIDADLGDVPVAFNLPLELELDPQDIRLEEVRIASGSLSVNVTRSQDENISGEFSINELVDDMGESVSFIISGTEPVGIAESLEIDLAGYTINPNFIPPNTNQINVTGTLLIGDNDQNTAESGSLLNISLDLANLEFEHAIGDFGNLDVSADVDTIELNIFQNIESGTFALTEAIINLDVTNTFGLPVLIELGDVVSVNQNSNVETQLFLDNIELAGQDVLGGAAEEISFTFDNENSDVTPLFDPAPVDVVFDITAVGNPNGPPPNDDLNFITSESGFDVDIDLILPLDGYADFLQVTDTLDIDISFDEFEEIDSLEFKLQTLNGFASDIFFQAVFIDEAGVALDSLFMGQQQIMTAAEVDANGDVVTPSEDITFITMSSDRANSLEMTERVRFRAVFNTPEAQNMQSIRIKETDELEIKLGVKIFGNLEL